MKNRWNSVRHDRKLQSQNRRSSVRHARKLVSQKQRYDSDCQGKETPVFQKQRYKLQSFKSRGTILIVREKRRELYTLEH